VLEFGLVLDILEVQESDLLLVLLLCFLVGPLVVDLVEMVEFEVALACMVFVVEVEARMLVEEHWTYLFGLLSLEIVVVV
jgi:uncharacterized membrane protein YhaH (DUF805 family)